MAAGALRSRLRALLAVVLLFAASCTGGETANTTTRPPSTTEAVETPATTTSTTTTSTTVPPTPSTVVPTTTTTTATLPPVELPAFDDDNDAVPIDRDVLIDKLPNGLTYYIRENRAPGGRAQLRLAVRAGSVQEVDEQRGAAHYLEHMMFNGTERFPANELIKVLSRFGAEFGPDVNAYTSYQETVYEIELATDDIETVEAGFDVLFEWATAVALDPEEVDLERGVLVEEWRLRDQGFFGRYFVGVAERLLEGSAFADRSPLADPAQLDTTTPEGLRAFFETWYRTDTMAVVAVGDFDAEAVEEMIIERFSDIATAVDPEPVPSPTVSTGTEPTYFVIADPEFPEAWSELNYPLSSIPNPATVGAIRQGLAFDLAFDMLAKRLEEDRLRGKTPFFDSGRASNDLVRAHRTPGVLAWADPEKLGTTTEALLLEVKRARIFGFSEDEFNRAVEEVRTAVQLRFDERATMQDRDFAADYVEHFIGGRPLPSAREEFDLYQRLLDELTPDQVWETFSATIDTTEPFVIIVAPENASDLIPDEAELAAIVERVEAAPVEARADLAVEIETLLERPDRAGVVRRTTFSDTGLPEIQLANGARIIMFQTPIRDDVVVMRARSPGGWSLVPVEDVIEAEHASDVTILSGVGGFDQVSLDRFLGDQVVFVRPFVTEVHEGLFGEATTGDLETLFQLINLYMSQPRFEEGARDLWVSEDLQTARNAELSPDLAVSIAIGDARFAGDPRFAAVHSVEDLETFDLARAAELYSERFANAGDFVFVFTGDFDVDVLEDLARSYIGTLPGDPASEGFTDTRPDPPGEIIEIVVEAGTGELGGVTLRFSTELTLDPEIRVRVALLELILQQRLIDRIREELSASYSPSSFASLVEEPVDSVEFTVRISADPADLDAVVMAALAEMADLRANGPKPDELLIARQQLLRDYELFSNEGLASDMLFYAEHPDEGFLEVFNRKDRLPGITRSDIRALARLLLPEDRYIDVRLVPIGFG